jgi:hypothetical protein
MGSPHCRTVGLTYSCEEQAIVIIDFCDGTYRGTRVFMGGFLLDRYCWGEAFDVIEIRLIHTTEKLSGIS